MANVLPRARQAQLLAALVEGNSERAVARITDVNPRTISRFALAAGSGAQRLHDRLVRDLVCAEIEVDEIWSYVGKKQARVTADDPPEVGEAFTFVALDRPSRLCISHVVGKRDQATTDRFTADLRARLRAMPQLMTSDGFVPYIAAIGASFGPGCTYAQVLKTFTSGVHQDDHRYEPPRELVLTKRAIYGMPDLTRASTTYVERNNGTMRHHIGRMRRLCYAFSKRLDHHRAAVALNYGWYNFGTVVKPLRMTPAMAAGLTDHVWELEEFLDVVMNEPAGEPPQPKPLEHVTPAGTTRELPNGRGFLRVIEGGRSPVPQPNAPQPIRAPSSPELEQLSLFDRDDLPHGER